MKIQLDLPEHLNKMIKVHKAINGFATLDEALINILNQYSIKEENKNEL